VRFLHRSGWVSFLPAIILICSTYSSPSFAASPVTTRLPIVFEPNRGQAPAETRYVLRGGALEGEFQNDGVRLRLSSGKKATQQVKMRLVGSREETAITGDGTLQGHTNYLVGNDPEQWLRGLPNYSEVRYSQIYPGTNLLFYGNGGSLEHDFEVLPGADPRRIAFQLDGAERVTLDEKGNLKIKLAGGTVTFGRPNAYQTAAGIRRHVDAAFLVGHDGTIRFRLGKYNPAEKLVIDPVLSFSTYLSPLASDADVIATDAGGNTYITGYGALGYPVTPGAFSGCTTCTANETVTFVSKLSPDGSNLIYSTVLGGNNFAQPTAMAVDGNGNVLVAGFTGATDFPTKNPQPIAPPNNAYLGFLVSLSPDGSSLNYGTMLGSPPSVSPAATTYASAVTFDAAGNAYVTGETGDGFFTTAGALNQAVPPNGSRNTFDIYLAKFSPAGALVYSAVLGTADPQNGGGGPIGASAIAVDAAGDAFVTGQAGTLWPISSNAYLKQIAGPMPYATPFVMKVAPDAKSVLYSTFLDYAYEATGIAVLPTGEVFVTGDGVGATYPTTANAYEQNAGGGSAFLTELNADGSALSYSTVIGDATYKTNGLALDPESNLWLAAQSSNAQLPLVNPIQTTFPPPGNFPEPASVVSEFDPTGQTLKFSTFLGGTASGYASSVAVDKGGKVHVSGAAGYGMYTTPGVYAGSVPEPGPGYSGATYAYVALIDPSTSGATLCLGGSAGAGLSFGYLLTQTTASQMVQATNCGAAPLNFTSVVATNPAFTIPAASNSCAGSLAVGSSCSLTVQFAPTAVQAYSGQLVFTSNASMTTTSIPLNGNGGEPVAGFGPAGINQTLEFSSLLVGQTGPAEIILLYNNGTVPLTIDLSQIAVTSGFVLAPGGNCTTSLLPNQYCSIVIRFAPTTAGEISGTLSVSSNDPVHPTITTSLTGTAFAAYPVPTITALQNGSYPMNSGTAPISMQVTGTNFFAASVVYINGVAQPTTYATDTYLSVTFSPSLLTAVGQIPITVVNPAPGGSSAPYPLTVYLSIPLNASALTIDPVGGLLYAAIPASATQNPNTIIPINPVTGATMTPIPVASDPRELAVSGDGSELYVASTGVLQRINLQTLAIEKTFNLPVDPEWGQTYAGEMHVVPGSPKSIVVELFTNVDPAEDGAALYNDSGLVNWVPGEAPTSRPLAIDSFTFTSAASIYALPMTGTFFTTLQVTPAGLSGTGGGGEFNEQTGSIVRSDGTLLYTNSGQVWDPSTQKLLGTYLESDGMQLFYTYGVVPDTPNGHTYFLDGLGGGLFFDVYDQASYALLGTVPFQGIYAIDAADLLRWGSKGFAFRTIDITQTDPASNQIVIATSDLVTSSSITPLPILASVSPANVYAGGPAYSMQLTGSGFTSSSQVLVNGNPRATTFVNGTSLTAQVLASDIAAVGQLNVQVTTPAPGGGTSNYVYVSIKPSLTTPAVTATLSATTLTTGQALTVGVAVSGGSSGLKPTGSVVLTGGGFTSPAVPLAGGAASIDILPGSLSAGADVLTVAYTPDSAASSFFKPATGTASITITAVLKNASTVTVTAASPAITNEQSDIVSITVTDTAELPVPTGTVALTSGSYRAQQALAGGAASITVPAGALGSGANVLTVTYSGDGAYVGSTGTASVQVVQVVMAVPPVTGLTPGGSTTANVTLSAGSNYSGTMNMSCTLVASPKGAQSLPVCSLTPVAVKIAAGATGSTVLAVQTTGSSTAANIVPSPANLFGLGGGTILAGLLLIGVPARGRRWMVIPVLLWVFVVTGASGCGGGGNSNSGSGSGGASVPPTTAGNYTFTVTGVDSANSSITSSTNLTLTVQ
jgi:Bacterial Ig-like domain (group 3)